VSADGCKRLEGIGFRGYGYCAGYRPLGDSAAGARLINRASFSFTFSCAFFRGVWPSCSRLFDVFLIALPVLLVAVAVWILTGVLHVVAGFLHLLLRVVGETDGEGDGEKQIASFFIGAPSDSPEGVEDQTKRWSR